jgi:hypothetical protein
MSSALRGIERGLRRQHRRGYLRIDPVARWANRGLARAWKNPIVRAVGRAVIIAVAIYFAQAWVAGLGTTGGAATAGGATGATGAAAAEGAAGAAATSAESLAAADAAAGLIPAGQAGAATTVGGGTGIVGTEIAAAAAPSAAQAAASAAPATQAAPAAAQATPVSLPAGSAPQALQPLAGFEQAAPSFLDQLVNYGGRAFDYLKDPKNALVSSSLIKLAGGALSPNETAMRLEAEERARQDELARRRANQAVGGIPLSYAGQFTQPGQRPPLVNRFNFGG